MKFKKSPPDGSVLPIECTFAKSRQHQNNQSFLSPRNSCFDGRIMKYPLLLSLAALTGCMGGAGVSPEMQMQMAQNLQTMNSQLVGNNSYSYIPPQPIIPPEPVPLSNFQPVYVPPRPSVPPPTLIVGL